MHVSKLLNNVISEPKLNSSKIMDFDFLLIPPPNGIGCGNNNKLLYLNHKSCCICHRNILITIIFIKLIIINYKNIKFNIFIIKQ